MSLLEFAMPLKNIRELGESVSKLRFMDVVKNYAESVPGVVGVAAMATKLGPQLATTVLPKLLTAKGLTVATGGISRATTLLNAAAKWWMMPAKGLLTAAKGSAIGSKIAPILLKGASVAKLIPGWGWALAGAAAIAGISLIAAQKRKSRGNVVIKGGANK